MSRSAEKCNGNTGCSSVFTQFCFRINIIYSFVITSRIVRKIKIGTEIFISSMQTDRDVQVYHVLVYFHGKVGVGDGGPLEVYNA